jgi:hypothetical protein
MVGNGFGAARGRTGGRVPTCRHPRLADLQFPQRHLVAIAGPNTIRQDAGERMPIGDRSPIRLRHSRG